MMIAHQQTLSETNYQMHHTKVTLKTQTIPRGVRSFTVDNLYKGKLPDRVIAAMVRDDAFTGDYNRNPFNFQHFHLNYMAMTVNSQLVPHSIGAQSPISKRMTI